MPSTATRVGHGLAKGLGIKLSDTNGQGLSRGESVLTMQTADTYNEQEPSVTEWVREKTPNGRDVGRFLYSLFPFVHWIGRYNLQWLYGDLVAGE